MTMSQGPLGKVTRAVWFDADGNTLSDPQGAVTGEIEETIEGGAVMRTYVDRRTHEEVVLESSFATDITPANQDGPKLTWDLWYFDRKHRLRLVETLEQLRSGLGHTQTDDRVWRSEVCHMLQLPFWQAAPQSLKDEAYTWLEQTRPLA